MAYLQSKRNELLICTDYLEAGNGFEPTRKAKALQPSLKVTLLALGDAIPAAYAEASWLEAIVAEADVVQDLHPLKAVAHCPISVVRD